MKSVRHESDRVKATYKPRKSKMGATPVRTNNESENAPSVKWGRYFLLAMFLGLGAALAVQVDWQTIYQKTYQATNRPLASIKIEGEFRFVEKQTLEQTISSRLDGSFVDLNLREIKSAIEINPWVAAVHVERIWPDSLKLKIDEHTPIARWNEDGFINQYGDLIYVESNQNLIRLPLLSGEEDKSAKLAQNYFFFSEMLKHSGLRIVSLVADDKMAWTIQLDQGFELKLGAGDIQSKLENFQYVYKTFLSGKKREIDRIDMRYEKGLAVKWKETTEYVAVGPGQ